MPATMRRLPEGFGSLIALPAAAAAEAPSDRRAAGDERDAAVAAGRQAGLPAGVPGRADGPPLPARTGALPAGPSARRASLAPGPVPPPPPRRDDDVAAAAPLRELRHLAGRHAQLIEAARLRPAGPHPALLAGMAAILRSGVNHAEALWPTASGTARREVGRQVGALADGVIKILAAMDAMEEAQACVELALARGVGLRPASLVSIVAAQCRLGRGARACGLVKRLLTRPHGPQPPPDRLEDCLHVLLSGQRPGAVFGPARLELAEIYQTLCIWAWACREGSVPAPLADAFMRELRRAADPSLACRLRRHLRAGKIYLPLSAGQIKALSQMCGPPPTGGPPPQRDWSGSATVPAGACPSTRRCSTAPK